MQEPDLLQARDKNNTTRRSTTAPRIVLVDQHAILREGLCALLEMTGRYSIVGEAETVASAQNVIVNCVPDLIVADIELRNESAVSLLSWVNRSRNLLN